MGIPTWDEVQPLLLLGNWTDGRISRWHSTPASFLILFERSV